MTGPKRDSLKKADDAIWEAGRRSANVAGRIGILGGW